MDPSLRDHLARRAITRFSLRYFRASPASNLHAPRAFYKHLPAPNLKKKTDTRPPNPKTNHVHLGLGHD